MASQFTYNLNSRGIICCFWSCQDGFDSVGSWWKPCNKLSESNKFVSAHNQSDRLGFRARITGSKPAESIVAWLDFNKKKLKTHANNMRWVPTTVIDNAVFVLASNLAPRIYLQDQSDSGATDQQWDGQFNTQDWYYELIPQNIRADGHLLVRTLSSWRLLRHAFSGNEFRNL